MRGGGRLNGMLATGVGLGPIRFGTPGAGLDGADGAGRAGIDARFIFGEGGLQTQ